MIKTENLCFEYRSEEESHIALCGVDLNIKKGEFVAILGHNGSGKSTISKHFNAILLPTGGKAYVGGFDTSDEKLLMKIRKTVGMVFQNPDNQIVATVVEEDVAFGPENMGVEPKEIRERVDSALEITGMLKYAKAAPHNLSGGQKQRVAIAGIIAMRPSCIVLDEPTAMLDPKGRREIMETIKKLSDELDITIVFITHYMDEAAMADRIIVMDNGKICMDDTPENIFSRYEEMTELGLDVPQVSELMYNLKKAGFDVNEKIISVDDCVNEITRLFESRKGSNTL